MCFFLLLFHWTTPQSHFLCCISIFHVIIYGIMSYNAYAYIFILYMNVCRYEQHCHFKSHITVFLLLHIMSYMKRDIALCIKIIFYSIYWCYGIWCTIDIFTLALYSSEKKAKKTLLQRASEQASKHAHTCNDIVCILHFGYNWHTYLYTYNECMHA